MGRATWTADMERFLRKNYEKYTSYELETQMWINFRYEVTRSAICGKLQRMGLSKGRGKNARHYMTTDKSVPLKPQKTVITHTKTLGEAGNNDCRFTTDEPKKGADMGICGRAVFKSGVCETCYPVVFGKVELNEHETNND